MKSEDWNIYGSITIYTKRNKSYNGGDILSEKALSDMFDEIIECIKEDKVKRGLDLLINGTRLSSVHRKDFNGSQICLSIIEKWIVSDWKDGAIEVIVLVKPRFLEIVYGDKSKNKNREIQD